MAKRVVLAVAGSGKTKKIIDKLELDSRTLIVTYTINNTSNIKRRIIDKFGFIPSGIRVYTYFSFLMRFCVRPIVGHKWRIKGTSFDNPPRFAKKDNPSHYMTPRRRLYHSRIAKLIVSEDMVKDVIKRIEKYYDFLCIDEVQDFAANDFNLLCELAQLNIEVLLVGDFYQHTFDTSRDGIIRKNLHQNYAKYFSEFKKMGFEVDLVSLSASHRCSPTICKFVNDILAIPMESHRVDEVNIELVTDACRVHELVTDNSIIKLFDKESNKYIGWTDNWGNTKGLDDFQDVCVVINASIEKGYKLDDLSNLAPLTHKKLYVACTRAKGNLYFIPSKLMTKYKK